MAGSIGVQRKNLTVRGYIHLFESIPFDGGFSDLFQYTIGRLFGLVGLRFGGRSCGLTCCSHVSEFYSFVNDPYGKGGYCQEKRPDTRPQDTRARTRLFLFRAGGSGLRFDFQAGIACNLFFAPSVGLHRFAAAPRLAMHPMQLDPHRWASRAVDDGLAGVVHHYVRNRFAFAFALSGQGCDDLLLHEAVHAGLLGFMSPVCLVRRLFLYGAIREKQDSRQP